MKKLPLFCLLVLFLAGCINKTRNYYVYKGTFFGNETVIKKITSTREVSSFISNSQGLNEKVLNRLKDYDNKFFKQKDLIIIYYPTGYSTDELYLKSIEINSEIKIDFNRNLKELVTEDLMGHLFLIEIEKLNKEVKININDIGRTL